MQDFLLWSLIGSVVLTAALNFLPVLFPRTAEKAGRKLQQKIEESIEASAENGDADKGPRVTVFFPWKTMLLLSVGLTILLNLASFFTGAR